MNNRYEIFAKLNGEAIVVRGLHCIECLYYINPDKNVTGCSWAMYV